MPGKSALDDLQKQDPRYSAEAYEFVMNALAYTVRAAGERRHVTGQELLFGMRDLALDCWGLMARHVLAAWGVRATEDFGEIVFNLVHAGLLSKTEEDSPNDFRNVFTFVEAFDEAYAPELDENGHVRRKQPDPSPDEPFLWAPLFGDTLMN